MIEDNYESEVELLNNLIEKITDIIIDETTADYPSEREAGLAVYFEGADSLSELLYNFPNEVRRLDEFKKTNPEHYI